MKQVFALVLAILAAGVASAQTDVVSLATQNDPAVAGAAEASVTAEAEPFAPLSAADVTLEQFLYLQRPVVIFADNPADPLFVQQVRLIAADPQALVERDVVVILDSDPAARTSVRRALRPRGFSLVLMDKDGKVMLRKPRPWDLREITHAIDKFPLRRQEMLEQMPSGR
jgi:hypothetical protein